MRLQPKCECLLIERMFTLVTVLFKAYFAGSTKPQFMVVTMHTPNMKCMFGREKGGITKYQIVYILAATHA